MRLVVVILLYLLRGIDEQKRTSLSLDHKMPNSFFSLGSIIAESLCEGWLSIPNLPYHARCTL